MPTFYESISDDLKEWILKQPVFYVASAPTVGSHINVSPKGLPSSSFVVLGPNKVAYLDIQGSGAETISHIYDNGRVTFMFNSFDKSPRICRLFSKGRVIECDSPEFPIMLKEMGIELVPGTRAIIIGEVFKVQTSCGYGVPILQGEFVHRSTLFEWAAKMDNKNPESPLKLEEYRKKWNMYSLDGNPSMKIALKAKGENLTLVEMKKSIRRWEANWDAVLVGVGIGAILGAVAARYAK